MNISRIFGWNSLLIAFIESTCAGLSFRSVVIFCIICSCRCLIAAVSIWALTEEKENKARTRAAQAIVVLRMFMICLFLMNNGRAPYEGKPGSASTKFVLKTAIPDRFYVNGNRPLGYRSMDIFWGRA